MVLHLGLTNGGKNLTEHLEAINLDEAIAFVKELANNSLEINEHHLK